MDLLFTLNQNCVNQKFDFSNTSVAALFGVTLKMNSSWPFFCWISGIIPCLILVQNLTCSRASLCSYPYRTLLLHVNSNGNWVWFFFATMRRKCSNCRDYKFFLYFFLPWFRARWWLKRLWLEFPFCKYVVMFAFNQVKTTCLQGPNSCRRS